MKERSEVILTIPRDAIPANGSVEISMSVGIDITKMKVLMQKPGANIVSPMAEFWAGQDFR